MDFRNTLGKFRPTKKKIVLSLIIALIVNILYWLLISSIGLLDIIGSIINNFIDPIVEWYIENVASMLFSASGIIIFLIIFLLIYIPWSLIEKRQNPAVG